MRKVRLVSAITVFALTFAPTILVSPPLMIVAVLLALMCVLFCVAASEFASPCARDIDAETPNPPVPYDTPTLALFDSFVLRVLSVSVLLTVMGRALQTRLRRPPRPARLPTCSGFMLARVVKIGHHGLFINSLMP
ncbi:hypothetical protein Q3A80_15220 [Burkholderia sp. SR8]